MLSYKSSYLTKGLKSLSLKSTTNLNNINRSIQTTSHLNAAPLKKKKQMDATILQNRVERKRRKFQRIIDQLESLEKIKIPLFEYSIEKHILKNQNEYTRKNEEKLREIRSEMERLNQIWSLYKGLENKFDFISLKKVEKTKLETLNELKRLSPFLYENSLKLDDNLFPFEDKQIVKETIANKDYEPGDGQIVNVTKEWKIDIDRGLW